ncbi:MAG: hypothetical protein AAGE94_14665 [Acidobacteriota bacterium]
MGHRVEDLPSLQRVPVDTYSDGPPDDEDGAYWDTDDTDDHNGVDVPTKVIAVMNDPDDGGRPSVDPPGWDFLKAKYGRLKGDWVRFHIINAKLGGPGGDPTNLLPTKHRLNHDQRWRSLEEGAKRSALDDQDWTYVEVSIDYDDDFPAGIPRRIDASWGYWMVPGEEYESEVEMSDDAEDDAEDVAPEPPKWFEVDTAGPLIQDNPDDGNNNNYLPASQITLQMLRGFGLTAPQAVAAKTLISGTFDDQDDFETALAGNSMTHDEVTDAIMVGNWFDVAGRFYVDEDDDNDGPYPVVVRST